MSGLAVLLGDNADPSAIEAMLCAAPHRGDVKAVRSGAGWALGIQALSTQSSFVAPALWTGGEVAVAMTGCLYRAESLMVMDDAAKRLGEAFLEDGPAGMATLEGSFAAVVVATTGSVSAVAIRSAMGERPLFWRAEDSTFAFASEVKQLLAAPMARPRRNPDGVMALMEFPGDDAPTCYVGVHRLPAGSWLATVPPQTHHRFWDKRDSVASSEATLAEAIEEFRSLLRTAVVRRLSSGAGVLLSGGFDSSAVAAEAAPAHRERYGAALRVVSATYPDIPRVDESRYIQATVERLGCEVTWVYPRPQPFADFDDELWLHDGPVAALGTSNGRLIFRGARDAGVTVFLDGHDGDSVFGTAGGLSHALLRRGKLAVLQRYVRFRRQAVGAGPGVAFRSIVVPGILDFAPVVRTVWHRFRPVPVQHPRIPSWISGQLHARMASPREPFNWFEAQWMYACAAVPFGLEMAERIALSEGLTALHPLADPNLVNFLLSLPPEIKFAGGAPKALIRFGYPDLPHEVISRKDKTNFAGAAEEGSPPEQLRQAFLKNPRKLPDVDWSTAESCLANGGVDRLQLRAFKFVISADRFLFDDAS